MTLPRRQLISLEETPYYHIVSRCVRRAFLCGFDEKTNTSYEYRKQWVENRIRILSSVFAVDICSYAVMSNHYHLVVKVCPEQTELLSDLEIMQRWTTLFKGPIVVQQFLRHGSVPAVHKETLDSITKTQRARLSDLSWFMRCLNEPIARMANKEDGCTGHFWEARFKSQALHNEQALLAAMAYVDLNPVRAKIAATPETSEHTSFKERVKPTFSIERAVDDQLRQFQVFHCHIALKPLLVFREEGQSPEITNTLPFRRYDYFRLVDWTGRRIHPDKRGAIAENDPPILERIHLPPDDWLMMATRFERYHRQTRNKRAA